MPDHVVSSRIAHALDAMAPFLSFLQGSAWSRRDPEDPRICDFVFGNPHEMPLPGVVKAWQEHLPPKNANWFAYKDSEPESRKTVAASLWERLGLPYHPEDVFMTNGAFAALSVSLSALVDPGDEVVFISPPWFFYESMIVAVGGTPVRVAIEPVTFDLALDAIAAALTPRTRAIIVNSPHNPTGKILAPDTLERLATILTDASDRFGRRIYLLSDEAYSRIVFDGRAFHSPTAYYPDSLLLYTYGKTLLTPGQRIGYIALPPAMTDRAPLRDALLAAQLTTGYAFPNALLQHSLADLETLSLDIGVLQRRRDRLVGALTDMGYDVTTPEATFYLVVRAPEPDDGAFSDRLAEHGVYVLPGAIFEMPGYFRLSLTANDEMVERSLGAFRRLAPRATVG
jgi:aspartate aminotransferase